MDYLASVHDWEIRSSRSFDAQHDDAGRVAVVDPIKAEKAAILQRLATPRGAATNTTVAFGTPATRDPMKTRLLSVETGKRDRALVVTEERSGPLPWEKQRYEYALQRVGGEWRINSRTSLDSDGKRIRGLL